MLVWDRLRTYFGTNRIFTGDRILGDNIPLGRMLAGSAGDMSRYSTQQAILEQTNLQINRLERYKDMSQMEEVGEISLALDLYADESSIVDPELNHTIIVQADNKRLRDEIEDFLYNTLLTDRITRPYVHYLCKYGDLGVEIVPTADRDGIHSLRPFNIYNFTRVETPQGDLVGFFFQDEFKTEPLFMHPWQVAHFRLTSLENMYHPYGRCVTVDTLVMTNDGLRRIDEIKPGDKMYSFNGDRLIRTEAVKFVCNGIKPILEIKTKNRVLKVTPEHPILVVKKKNYTTLFGAKRKLDAKEYVQSKDLKIGDYIMCIDDAFNGVLERITSIKSSGKAKVGDIQVKSRYHNFIANGAVVHNSILDGARKSFKQLRLMEDAALIHRLTRASERRVFYIPTGHLPSNQSEEYLQKIAQQFKKHRFYDPNTGKINTKWSPLVQEDDFWIPVRSGVDNIKIDTLKGAENLDQIQDIEYFKKKMISALKIPFSRVGLGGEDSKSNQSLSQIAPEFAKAVQWIQREFVYGMKKVVLVHLALRGYSIEDMKSFDIAMAGSSAIDTLYRIETWKTRADVISKLNSIGLFPKPWILKHFGGNLTQEEIDEALGKIKIEAAKEKTEGEQPGGGGVEGLGGILGLEGYNASLHKALIMEQGKIEADREVKSKYISGIKHYAQASEFAGLSKEKPSTVCEELDTKATDNNQVVKETAKKLLVESKRLLITEGSTPSNDVITEEDLPVVIM